MNGSAEKPRVAWQPLTVKGVAAFAQAPLRRLLLVQLIVALLAAGLVVWVLYQDWFPVVGEAIRHLPPQGELRSGILNWQDPTPMRLAENRFLALVVDLDHTGELRSPAQVEVEFGRNDCVVFSLFGQVGGTYRPAWTVAFNRTDLLPWWGAWWPAILAIVAGFTVGGLVLSWAGLATLYFLPTWLIGFFMDRDLSLGGSWRLAGAALMPGALLLSAALFLYGSGGLDLVRLAVAAVLHLVMSWIYLAVSPLYLARRRMAAKENPFA